MNSAALPLGGLLLYNAILATYYVTTCIELVWDHCSKSAVTNTHFMVFRISKKKKIHSVSPRYPSKIYEQFIHRVKRKRTNKINIKLVLYSIL